MAVPAHDERDFEFAKMFGLPIVEVVRPPRSVEGCFVGDGVAVNSDFLDTLQTSDAQRKMIVWLEEKGLGERATTYRLRDWVFSRQRYWGEPIPIVICKACGYVPVPEDQLPFLLPDAENYQPTHTRPHPHLLQNILRRPGEDEQLLRLAPQPSGRPKSRARHAPARP